LTLSSLLAELRGMGITDARVLDALAAVKREDFVRQKKEAYENYPLPIGWEQTISQPYTVAFMLEALELSSGLRVLEVGAGSGWNAALLGKLVAPGEVISTEIISELALSAEQNVRRAGISNVRVVCADGSLGFSGAFDRIIVTAACPAVPPPLVEQLADDGVLLAPVGEGMFGQDLVKLRKRGGRIERQSLGSFVFVPLRGRHGV